jgi:hypothetical protein
MRIDKLIKLKSQYRGKLAQQPRSTVRLQQIVVSLLSSPLTTIPVLAKQFNVSFPTAQEDVRKLIALEILHKSSRENKPQYHIAHEFFAAAYDDDD